MYLKHLNTGDDCLYSVNFKQPMKPSYCFFFFYFHNLIIMRPGRENLVILPTIPQAFHEPFTWIVKPNMAFSEISLLTMS